MAGRGPAPKDERRRRNEPARGEWVELAPLRKPVLPPAKRGWSARVKRLWKAWRDDPVTSQYTSADVAAAWELADLFETIPFSEQRLRMDGLGLTPKGKRDLRLKVFQGEVAQSPQSSSGGASRRASSGSELRAV